MNSLNYDPISNQPTNSKGINNFQFIVWFENVFVCFSRRFEKAAEKFKGNFTEMPGQT